MAQSAKLQALHYQINPHFLFNSFNAVSALILDGRADDANAMVERLASFFRVNLATNPDVNISLAEEIALRSDEHTTELQSLMRISYAVFGLTKNQHNTTNTQ